MEHMSYLSNWREIEFKPTAPTGNSSELGTFPLEVEAGFTSKSRKPTELR